MNFVVGAREAAGGAVVELDAVAMVNSIGAERGGLLLAEDCCA